MSNYRQLEGHTFQRYDGELNHVHLTLLEMGGLVTDQVREALDSIKYQDLEKACYVCEREYQVDALEKKIDSHITAVLAKRGPVARDLRGLMAFSKAVTDLERIGNEALRIASISKIIYGNDVNKPGSNLLHDVHAMGNVVYTQLQESLNFFDELDFARAEILLNARSHLDEEFEVGLRRLTTYVMEDSRNVGHVINIVLVLKSLERIGDHAHNLAEYVVYLVSGEDVRHPVSN
jgi:phosphate transport system protein